MDYPARRVLIVGAGPGGLSTAIALRRVGIEAAVFERASELGDVGQGLGLQSNATRALMRIGAHEGVIRTGSTLRTQEIHNGDGKLIFTLPQGEIGDRVGAPTIGLLRSRLQFALLDQLPNDVVELGCECTRVEQDASGVYACFANGRRERGALLIGADGSRSVVREHIYGDEEPPLRYSGITIWRAVLERGAELLPPGTSKYYNGLGLQFVMFPVGGERLYWGAAKLAAAGGRDQPGRSRETLLGSLGNFPELPRRAVAMTPENEIVRGDLYDRDPARNWVKGRVVLLGDAAHLTTPFIGQGAGISIEDAVVLGKELALTDGLRDQRMLGAALASYQRARVPRCEQVVLTSRRLGRSTLTTSRASAKTRDIVMGHLPGWARRALIARNVSYTV